MVKVQRRECRDESTVLRVRSLEPTSVESTRVEGAEARVTLREQRRGFRAKSIEYRVDGTVSRAQSSAQCESTVASALLNARAHWRAQYETTVREHTLESTETRAQCDSTETIEHTHSTPASAVESTVPERTIENTPPITMESTVASTECELRYESRFVTKVQCRQEGTVYGKSRVARA